MSHPHRPALVSQIDTLKMGLHGTTKESEQGDAPLCGGDRHVGPPARSFPVQTGPRHYSRVVFADKGRAMGMAHVALDGGLGFRLGLRWVDTDDMAGGDRDTADKKAKTKEGTSSQGDRTPQCKLMVNHQWMAKARI